MLLEYIPESKIDLAKNGIAGRFSSKKKCVIGSYSTLVEMADGSGYAILDKNGKVLDYRFEEVSTLLHDKFHRKNSALIVKLKDDKPKAKKDETWKIFNTKTGQLLPFDFKKIMQCPIRYKASIQEINKLFSYFGQNFVNAKEFQDPQYGTRVLAGFNCFVVQLADEGGYTLFNAETCKLSATRFAGVEMFGKGVVPFIFPTPKDETTDTWTFDTPIGAIANISLTRQEVRENQYQLLELLSKDPVETRRNRYAGVRGKSNSHESFIYADAIVESIIDKNTDCQLANEGILKRQMQKQIFAPCTNCDKKFLNDFRIKTDSSSNLELTELRKSLRESDIEE